MQDDDPVNAEVFIKKAHVLMSSCTDPATTLQYKVCYARILDSKRRFLEAATRYYELSQLDTAQLAGKVSPPWHGLQTFGRSFFFLKL
eukprot:scaffold633740_cov55-Prasinocladus_malaysianus.AAC.1